MKYTDRTRGRAAVLAGERRQARRTVTALLATTLALAAALTLGACSGNSTIGDVLGQVLGQQQPASGGNLVATVNSVDTRSQVIDVTTQNGQTGGIYYDNNTQVVYQNQQYPVTALERGDVVEMNVQQTNNGYYTNYILVRQSAQASNGGYGGTTTTNQQTVQASGQVSQIDYQRGWFDLRTQNGTVTVSLPYNPPSTTETQFNRLRNGDYVNVEGYLIANNRIELTRFM